MQILFVVCIYFMTHYDYVYCLQLREISLGENCTANVINAMPVSSHYSSIPSKLLEEEVNFVEHEAQCSLSSLLFSLSWTEREVS